MFLMDIENSACNPSDVSKEPMTHLPTNHLPWSALYCVIITSLVKSLILGVVVGQVG